MQEPSRLWLLGVALALSACTIELPAPNREIIDAPIPSGSGAQASSEPADVSAAVAMLDGELRTGSGTDRFLQSGVMEYGPIDAKVTLTVFTEQHCAYCNDFSNEMLPWLLSDFGDTLQIRIVPVVLQKYPNSRTAAEALICAGKTGSGSAMFRLLAERENKHRSSVIEYAEELHIDTPAFSACLDAEETKAMLTRQREVANAADVSLVPAFVLNGEKRVGLPLYADLRGWIESALRE